LQPHQAAFRFVSATSHAENLRDGIADLVGAGEELNAPPSLAVLFFSPHWLPLLDALVSELRSALRPGTLLGVTAESVIGADEEIEDRPGLAFLAGVLPGVTLQPFAISADEWQGLLSDEERLQQRAGAGETHRGHLVLADPFTTPVEELLRGLDGTLKAPCFGGMASGAQRAGGNRLIFDDQLRSDGAIGVGFGGPLRIDTVVSQGCRPVGDPWVVTRANGPWILELGRRSALEVTQSIIAGLSPDEMSLIQSAGLFVGVAINEYRPRFSRGDFLVRGLMGASRETGGLAVGDHVRAGQTIQFHVRDASTAHEDLLELLQPQTLLGPPAAGLLFSCNGRGQRMFPAPHHDVQALHSVFPDLPAAGFFAMGELGPIGGKTFIHGHTASIALLRAED
jgi:small ligand-binding sensory domain FIST